MPDVLFLIGDKSALHDMLTSLASSSLLRIERILLAKLEGEALPAFAALPADSHLIREE